MPSENLIKPYPYSIKQEPFTLSMWFDKLTMIGLNPFALSLSKDKLSTNGNIYSILASLVISRNWRCFQ